MREGQEERERGGYNRGFLASAVVAAGRSVAEFDRTAPKSADEVRSRRRQVNRPGDGRLRYRRSCESACVLPDFGHTYLMIRQ